MLSDSGEEHVPARVLESGGRFAARVELFCEL